MRKVPVSNAELIRLDAIVMNLGLGKSWAGPEMTEDIVAACVATASPILAGTPAKGERIAERLAIHYRVKFREVRGATDIDALELEYLRSKREAGFVQLRLELQDPNVDALLFQRIYASDTDPDRWVAVLNLQRTEKRAYWNRFHELSHRIAEPEQGLLPFRRERSLESKSQVETLIDCIAAELGFHKQYFGPMLGATQGRQLSFTVISSLREAFSPTASLVSVTNIVVSRWNRPALAFTASVHGRLGNDLLDRALRVDEGTRKVAASSNHHAQDEGLYLFKNMRVPRSSIVYRVFESRKPANGLERGGIWETSTGEHLPDRELSVSAIPFGDNRVFALMSA